MKIAPKLRRKLIVAGVLFACAATPSFAIFGLGDIVFDPTNYAELITQATTAYSHYTAFVHNVEHFNWKQSWQTEKNALEHVPFKDVFGETDGMDTALTTNNSAAAQAAWQNSTVQVNSGATVYLASQNSGSASRSQLAMIEASDSTSPACLNAVGPTVQPSPSMPAPSKISKSSQLDTGDDTNSEVQQLNLVNAAQAQQLVEMKQQGLLHACLAQQMAVANMQQRNAAANDLNTWGFFQQQRQMNNANPSGGSSTWTTYLP